MTRADAKELWMAAQARMTTKYLAEWRATICKSSAYQPGDGARALCLTIAKAWRRIFQ